mmetsp:Transcript_22219/g.61564  ORF Transcript_22219/g.61564 Transcript_22219/m.61564 type:complete len:205 (+) Transcript_22219:155-769(+)
MGSSPRCRPRRGSHNHRLRPLRARATRSPQALALPGPASPRCCTQGRCRQRPRPPRARGSRARRRAAAAATWRPPLSRRQTGQRRSPGSTEAGAAAAALEGLHTLPQHPRHWRETGTRPPAAGSAQAGAMIPGPAWSGNAGPGAMVEVLPAQVPGLRRPPPRQRWTGAPATASAAGQRTLPAAPRRHKLGLAAVPPVSAPTQRS